MNTYFHGKMKMADLIMANYKLLNVLQRFNIEMGFGERSVERICQQLSISEPFFLAVCNTYTFKEYSPEVAHFDKSAIYDILKYLKNSHLHYSDFKIMQIENLLNELENGRTDHHFQMIRSFFAQYKHEITQHFSYEEHVVFPYIEKVIQSDKDMSSFKIDIYAKHHDNIEDKLNDLKNIIIKYLPDPHSTEVQINLLIQLFMLEEDLNKHTLIEDKILIPFVQSFEDLI